MDHFCFIGKEKDKGVNGGGPGCISIPSRRHCSTRSYRVFYSSQIIQGKMTATRSVQRLVSLGTRVSSTANWIDMSP